MNHDEMSSCNVQKNIPINNYHRFISVKGFLPNSHTHKSQIRELTRHDVISMIRRKSVCWVKDILTRRIYRHIQIDGQLPFLIIVYDDMLPV